MRDLDPTDLSPEEAEIARLEGALWTATASPGAPWSGLAVRLTINVDRDGEWRLRCEGFPPTRANRQWAADKLRRVADHCDDGEDG